MTLDQKGRLSIPSRYREAFRVVGNSLTITRHPDGCLVIYPTTVWEEKREKLKRLPYAARGFVRFVLGSAVDVDMDRAGRILIPADLRELSALTQDVALVGLGEHFELWNRQTLLVREREALENGLDAADFTF